MTTNYVRFITAIFIFFHLNTYSNACEPNIVDVSDPDTPLYISDFAVSLDASNCPTSSVSLDEPLKLENGQFIQFWFRLQGNADYLNSHSARNRFVFRFARFSGGTFVPFDALAVKGISIEKGLSEAATNEGNFDWRIWVRKKFFLRPGTYSLSLHQAGQQICFKEQEAIKCEKQFRTE